MPRDRDGKPSYGVYGPVRYRREMVVFLMAVYHAHCCMEAEVLNAAGEILVVNPRELVPVASVPYTFDAEYYDYYEKRRPVKGWEKYAALKKVADEYMATPTDVRVKARIAANPRVIDDAHPFGGRHAFPYEASP